MTDRIKVASIISESFGNTISLTIKNYRGHSETKRAYIFMGESSEIMVNKDSFVAVLVSEVNPEEFDDEPDEGGDPLHGYGGNVTRLN